MIEHARSSDIRVFWQRVWAALSRLLALLIFIGAHWVLNRALAYVVPPNLSGTLVFAQDVIYVFFLMVYAYLAWDMLTVFVPRLKRPFYPGQESKLKQSESND